MNVDGVQRVLRSAARDGGVDGREVDRLMLQVRDEGGLSSVEWEALVRAADGFDDRTRQRLLRHLTAMGQPNAWVNVDVPGALASLDGRFATLTHSIPGLSVRVGLFDSSFGLCGRARADGVFSLKVDGQTLSVPVRAGAAPGEIVRAIRERLPPQIASTSLGDGAQPHEAKPADAATHLFLYRPGALGLRAGERPMRVVVTGYGAFMGIMENPSAAMAQRLAERGLAGAVVEYRRLDVTREAVESFVADVRRDPPDVVLSLGVSPGKAQVEERPENQLRAAPDGDGAPLVEGPVRSDGPPERPTDLPVDRIDWALEGFQENRRIFTSRSDPEYQPDRSAYLCNYLGYLLALEFGASPQTTAGFIHIRADTPFEQMGAVLDAIGAAQLEARRAQQPSS
jgi:pyrrolidone-carboxylate peptidase